MDQPVYYPVQAADVPKYTTDDNLVTINVFSGEVMDLKGKIPTLTPVNASTLEVKKDGYISIAIPRDFNTFLYLLDGRISLDGYGLVDGGHAVVFKQDGDGISFKGFENTRALLMSGLPLNEEVVSHGPFVMNNQTQILEAMRDYQMGKMGLLIED